MSQLMCDLARSEGLRLPCPGTPQASALRKRFRVGDILMPAKPSRATHTHTKCFAFEKVIKQCANALLPPWPPPITWDLRVPQGLRDGEEVRDEGRGT